MKERTDQYRVEISANAWSQLGHVPQAIFAVVQKRLLEVAREAARQGSSREVRGSALVAEGFVATYAVDGRKGLITLLDVVRSQPVAERPPAEGEPGATGDPDA